MTIEDDYQDGHQMWSPRSGCHRDDVKRAIDTGFPLGSKRSWGNNGEPQG
jgi:hypothetical protein